MKWFNLLKPGTFKDAKGNDITITSGDLDTIAGSYDPDKAAAAFTVGHPKSQKEPSYGFAAALRRVGDIIQFTPGKLVAEFATAVNEGKFPRVSAGLQKVKDQWQLNHIAFLGAWQPAVEGLGMVEFAAEGVETLEPESDDWRPESAEFAAADVVDWVEGRFNTLGHILTGLREFIISKYDVETADKFLSKYDLEYIGSSAPKYVEEPAAAFASAAQPAAGIDYQALFAGAQTEITRISADLAEANTKIKTFMADAKKSWLDKVRAEFASFVDSKKDRVYPAEKDIIVNTLMTLSKAEFAAAVTDINTPEVAAYKSQIEARPVHNLTKEIATGGRSEEKLSAMELAQCAEEYVVEMEKKGARVSYSDAVGFVISNPEKFQK